MHHRLLTAAFGLALLTTTASDARAQLGFPDIYIAAGAGGAILTP
jgi:hypothetical protein